MNRGFVRFGPITMAAALLFAAPLSAEKEEKQEEGASRSFVDLRHRLKVGDRIYVTEGTGRVVRGRLEEFFEGASALPLDKPEQRYIDARGEETRNRLEGTLIESQQQPSSTRKKSRLTLVLLGAGLAIAGAFLVADREEEFTIVGPTIVSQQCSLVGGQRICRPDFVPGTSKTVTETNKGKLYGGIGLAAGGAGLILAGANLSTSHSPLSPAEVEAPAASPIRQWTLVLNVNPRTHVACQVTW